LSDSLLRYWAWEDTWTLVFTVAVVAGLVTGFTAIRADHSIQSYYIEKGVDGNPCVKGRRNWQEDSRIYCSDDLSKVTELMKTLNAQTPAGLSNPSSHVDSK